MRAPPKSVSLTGRLALAVGTVGHEHVLRLDVAVDHAAGVSMGEGVRECQADLGDPPVGEIAAGDQLGEGLAVDELGDQVESVVLDVGLVQGDDRRMGQAGGGERLATGAVGHASSPAPTVAAVGASGGRGMRLSATSRCRSSSWARQTTPKPPAPRRSRRR